MTRAEPEARAPAASRPNAGPAIARGTAHDRPADAGGPASRARDHPDDGHATAATRADDRPSTPSVDGQADDRPSTPSAATRADDRPSTPSVDRQALPGDLPARPRATPGAGARPAR